MKIVINQYVGRKLNKMELGIFASVAGVIMVFIVFYVIGYLRGSDRRINDKRRNQKIQHNS